MSNGYIQQRWERKTNRETIISLLFQKAYRYNALFEASGFGSKSTLNNHLKKLQEEGVVEKAIENNETVYRLTLNPNMLLPEIKNMMFDLFVKSFDEKFPGLAVIINSILLGMWKLVFVQKIRKIDNKPEYTPLELTIIAPDIFKESFEKLDTKKQIDNSTLTWLIHAIMEGFTRTSEENSS